MHHSYFCDKLWRPEPGDSSVVSGNLVDFGTYEDVITDHERSRQLGLSLDFGPIPEAEYFVRQDRPVPRTLEVSFSAGSEHPAVFDRSRHQGR